MTPKKLTKAFEIAKIPNMPAVRAHILRNITHDDKDGMLTTLTTKQLALVIKAAHHSYHDGKSECAASKVDDCFWIGGDVQKLIPIDALKALTIDRKYDVVPRKPTSHDPSTSVTWTVTSYKLDYQERL